MFILFCTILYHTILYHTITWYIIISYIIPHYKDPRGLRGLLEPCVVISGALGASDLWFDLVYVCMYMDACVSIKKCVCVCIYI